MRRAWWSFAGLTLIIVTTALIWWLTTPVETTLERAQRTGMIRIGYAPEAPFAYRSASGEMHGEAAVVMTWVMQRLGIPQLEWVQTEWADLIPGLQAGKFDLIASGMFITCERAQLLAFSQPTFALSPAILVQFGNPLHIQSFSDFRRPDRRLAVMRGAEEATIAQILGIDAQQLLFVPDVQTGLAAVLAGRADGLALTDISVDLLVQQAPDQVERAQPFVPPIINGNLSIGYGAFAMRPADTHLRSAIDQQLLGFIGSDEHYGLIAPFGFAREQLPNRSTASILQACEHGS
ncbi:ectoine/hydroxyectoine ABC transporter substrate-binding protein EhuB [Herpetosiphon giganteus]|uniref:ectoine/hydroxyectoine ABC transporter substrate-binding protein EhuB n=1 Tax=Herpetosiphon giganteus TaxID=2029754 RepID=UPI001956BEF3|nr:ectoine/hydroxyectoine ABC transporter substrate-binding protein EhuB [Herpetosiphon giganteus]MBM7844788.1 polar amino acid transport system substrate-binding protein [Herpetosiphon giganteus]